MAGGLQVKRKKKPKPRRKPRAGVSVTPFLKKQFAKKKALTKKRNKKIKEKTLSFFQKVLRKKRKSIYR